MEHSICPWWLGYFLLSPFRKWFENPDKLLALFIEQGMTVLELGCGMGYFTLPIARMIGSEGKVAAVDVEQKMLSSLKRRAENADLLQRIEIVHAGTDNLGVKHLENRVDLAVALHMVHEVPEKERFFAQLYQTLKIEGKLLIVEPRLHVSAHQFRQTILTARETDFEVEDLFTKLRERGALLSKPSK